MKISLFFCLLVCFNFVYGIEILKKGSFKLDESKIFYRTIQVDHSISYEANQHRCTYITLAPNQTAYIIGIYPEADKNIVHHLTLRACSGISNLSSTVTEGNTWECYPRKPAFMCNDNLSRRLYLWSLNANGTDFPDGAGYRVGGITGLDYLAIQVHYVRKFVRGQVDNFSKYVVKMTTQELPYQLGLIVNEDTVDEPLPHSENYEFKTACKLDLPYDIVPINYRPHTHSLGKVVSNYLVRNETWTEIGRMSPKQPQAFYPILNKDMIAKKGDIVAAMCLYDTTKADHPVRFGFNYDDEMCHVYTIYYTDYKGLITTNFVCMKKVGFEYSDAGINSNPPKNYNTLDGVVLPQPDLEMDMVEE